MCRTDARSECHSSGIVLPLALGEAAVAEDVAASWHCDDPEGEILQVVTCMGLHGEVLQVGTLDSLATAAHDRRIHIDFEATHAIMDHEGVMMAT